MSRVLVIGIDGMDQRLLSKFENHLPNISKIKKESPRVHLTSVFPPDSETAWASIYTGLNPAKHGVVHFLDPLEKSLMYQSKDSDSAYIKGKTFWDIAGENGKKVCILLPHIGYPVWPINGIFVGRSSVRDDVQAYPVNINNEFDLKKLNTIKGFPGKGGLSHMDFIIKHQQLLDSTTEFGLKMFNKEYWDIFFIYSSILDVVPHFFWKYFDKEDPTYPGQNEYEDVIRNLYKLHGKMIQKFYSLLDKDTVLIVLSDHGHGRRPITNVNINRILAEKHLLSLNTSNSIVAIIEKLRRKALFAVGRHNLENFASKLLKFVPQIRSLYLSPPEINWKKTSAVTSDLSGIKSYSYGGIRINREIVKDNITYEKLRDEIINLLLELSDPTINKKLVKWAMRCEKLYEGDYIYRYPDIVFELLDDYGIGHRVNASLIEDSPSHGIVPGSHKGDSAVFFILNSDRRCARDNMTLMDVTPTILDLLNVDGNFNFDGRSIFK